MEHTSKKSNKSQYVFFGLLISVMIYVFSQHTNTAFHAQAAGTTVTSTSLVQSGIYANGSYTGSAADAYYGTIQVKAIVQNGKIADVQFLQYPNSHSNSVYINNQAMPILTQETIQAQSANVSGVSGATLTSQAFEQSLASALAQARV